MANGQLNTPGDLIKFSLKYAGVIGVGQTASAEDTNDALVILNFILSEWQINRWLSYDLVEISNVATGSTSYQVGPGLTFNTPGQRPDKLDAVFVTNANATTSTTDTFCYPFMSREGYDRIPDKTTSGLPFSYFYDPAIGTHGNLYLYPVPDNNYVIKLNCKANLGQFTTLTQSIGLPQPYVVALMAVLSSRLRPLYGLPVDQQLEMAAAAAIQTLISSIAQVPQAVQPAPVTRSGIYSAMPPAQTGGAA